MRQTDRGATTNLGRLRRNLIVLGVLFGTIVVAGCVASVLKTREIAVEYARRKLRANALCPGPVNTPLLQSLLADPARRARRLVHIPMGRLAEPDEIANAVVFLASDEASYVNGTTFLVDGGISGAYVTPE